MNEVKLPHYGLYGLHGGQVSTETRPTKNVNAGDADNPPGTMFSRWWDGLFDKEDNKTAKEVVNNDVKKSSWLQNAGEIVDIFKQIPGVEDWFSKNIGEKYLGWNCPRNTDSCEAKEVKDLEDFVKTESTKYRFTKSSIQRLTEKQVISSLNRMIDDYSKREALLRSIATTYPPGSSSIQARIFGADRTREAKLIVIAFVNDFLAIQNKHIAISSNNAKTAKDWTGKSFTYQSPIYKTASGSLTIDTQGNAVIKDSSFINTANVGIITTTLLLSALAYTYYSSRKGNKNV